MSGDIVICVEGLGKKYPLTHEADRKPYHALRDVLSGAARDAWRKAIALTRGRASLCETSEDFWALKDVSFEVRRGEILGVIGRNGAGKSTLLKILSRITEPSEGKVRIKGRVSSLLEVGTGFHPELTGQENIYLNGAILGMTRTEIKQKFDEIVAFAEVERFLDTPMKRYSSGMHARLAFAVAAHLEPDIMVVDEVLAVGDAEFQKKCLGKMSEVASGGRTVLFVSHNMGAVSNLCPRCVLLNQGTLVGNGPSSELIGEYMNSKVSKFDPTHFLKRGRETALIGAEIAGRDVNGNCALWSGGFSVEFLYRAAAIPNLELSFDVADQHGRRVFYSSTKHPYAGRQAGGVFAARVKIPARFLAPGTYSVSAALHRPNVKLYDEIRDLVPVTIIADNPEHYQYGNDDLGVVTVDLDWTLERLPTKLPAQNVSPPGTEGTTEAVTDHLMPTV